MSWPTIFAASLNGQLVRSHRLLGGPADRALREAEPARVLVRRRGEPLGGDRRSGARRRSGCGRHAPPAPCPSAEGELAGVWDGGRKAQIEAAFSRATKLPFAGDVLRATERSLDAYAASWAERCARRRAPATRRARDGSRASSWTSGWRVSPCAATASRSLTSRFATPDNTVVEHSVEATGAPATPPRAAPTSPPCARR